MKQALVLFPLVCLFLLLANCRKNHDPDCRGATLPSGQFYIKEMIGDTSFIADTIFRDNYVKFQAKDKYESVSWKIGNDPRTWTDSNFNLSFLSFLGTIPLSFTGHKTPNKACFPSDTGIYSSGKDLTVVEQVQKPILTLSPLIGKYKGNFNDTPTDTFTVRMEYFDSSRYDVSITGSKNFYWFSNFPKGYTSTLALPYPELRNGFRVEMGYKCFVFDYDGYSSGKAWLSHDTLFIISGTDAVGRRRFIGKKL